MWWSSFLDAWISRKWMPSCVSWTLCQPDSHTERQQRNLIRIEDYYFCRCRARFAGASHLSFWSERLRKPSQIVMFVLGHAGHELETRCGVQFSVGIYICKCRSKITATNQSAMPSHPKPPIKLVADATYIFLAQLGWISGLSCPMGTWNPVANELRQSTRFFSSGKKRDNTVKKEHFFTTGSEVVRGFLFVSDILKLHQIKPDNDRGGSE